MKHLSLMLVVLTSQLSGMERQITIQKRPSDILEIEVSSNDIFERLSELHLNNFVKYTRIHEKIGNKKMLPGAMYLHINKEIFSYLQTVYPPINDPIFTEQHSLFIRQNKAPMVKAILRDHPVAITYLIREGFLKEQPIEQNNSSPIIPQTAKPFTNNPPLQKQEILWNMFRNDTKSTQKKSKERALK